MKRVLLTTFVLAILTACAPPPTEAIDECGVSNPAIQTQALAPLPPPELELTLDEDLGGLSCFPGNLEACQQQLETQCIGELAAVLGVDQTVAVSLSSAFSALVVQSIAMTSDCGWALNDSSGFTIDGAAPVPVNFTFSPSEVGTCDGRLAIVSNEGSADGDFGTDTIILRATVVAAQ